MKKIDEAVKILKNYPHWTRKSLIEEIQYSLNMSAAGASTYYYNAKKIIEEEQKKKDKAKADFNNSESARRAREQQEKASNDRMRAQAERLRRAAEAAMRSAKAKTTNRQQSNKSADWDSAFKADFGPDFRILEEMLRRAAQEEILRRQREEAARKAQQTTQKWFEILGINATASKAEINTAWKTLCKKHHPDLGGKVEDMQKINAARDLGLRMALN